eukprot:scaffold182_cov350-Prasinococcus_capsulatus_cf.AAC.20
MRGQLLDTLHVAHELLSSQVICRIVRRQLCAVRVVGNTLVRAAVSVVYLPHGLLNVLPRCARHELPLRTLALLLWTQQPQAEPDLANGEEQFRGRSVAGALLSAIQADLLVQALNANQQRGLLRQSLVLAQLLVYRPPHARLTRTLRPNQASGSAAGALAATIDVGVVLVADASRRASRVKGARRVHSTMLAHELLPRCRCDAPRLRSPMPRRKPA